MRFDLLLVSVLVLLLPHCTNSQVLGGNSLANYTVGALPAIPQPESEPLPLPSSALQTLNLLADPESSITVDPALGLSAVIGGVVSPVTATITQQLLVSGTFAEAPNISLLITQFAAANNLTEDAITAWSTTFYASTIINLPGAAYDTADAAVSTAMSQLLEQVVNNSLSIPAATSLVSSKFTASNDSGLQATVQFLSNASSAAANATLTQLLHALSDGSFNQILHAAATAALSPSTAGEGGSTIPAAVLQPLQNCTAIAAGGSITVLPTADIQLRITIAQPSSEDALSFADALQQSVTCGQLASAMSSAAGYPVHITSDPQSQVYVGRALTELDFRRSDLEVESGRHPLRVASARTAITAGLGSRMQVAVKSDALSAALPLTTLAGVLLLLGLLA